MPYLEVSRGNEEEIEVVEEVTVPNLIGLSLKDAENSLKESGLELVVSEIIEDNKESIDKQNSIIKEQTPTEGIKINKGNKVFVKY